jgi:hypothetical protein
VSLNWLPFLIECSVPAVYLPQGLARELLPRPEHMTVAMDAKARHMILA